MTTTRIYPIVLGLDDGKKATQGDWLLILLFAILALPPHSTLGWIVRGGMLCMQVLVVFALPRVDWLDGRQRRFLRGLPFTSLFLIGAIFLPSLWLKAFSALSMGIMSLSLLVENGWVEVGDDVLIVNLSFWNACIAYSDIAKIEAYSPSAYVRKMSFGRPLPTVVIRSKRAIYRSRPWIHGLWLKIPAEQADEFIEAVSARLDSKV